MALIEKSGNPALSEKIFQRAERIPGEEGTMTIGGTLNKFAFIFLMMMCSSVYSWFAFEKNPSSVGPMIMIGVFGGLAIAFIIMFKMQWAKYLAPAYGIFEGLFLGAFSAIITTAFKGKNPYIAMQAVLLTFGVVVAMWALYRFRIIRVTQKLYMVIIGATAGIFIFYMLSWILGFFHVNVPILDFTNGSTFSIIFSLVVVGVAALNLLLDFDMIDKSVMSGAPKYMEWYGAFALTVTIVWLYIEILRLLAKLNSR